MSRRNVRQSIHDMVDFMKNRVNSNIVESTDINVDEATMTQLTGLVDLSISQAFSLAYTSVDSALSEFEKDIQSKSKTGSKKSTKR